jgi:flagellar basal-body rod protein FlgB
MMKLFAVEVSTATIRRSAAAEPESRWVSLYMSLVRRLCILWYNTCLYRPQMLDSITQSLGKYMDVLAAREKLVTSNIANADTPGYRTVDLDFQKEFQSLLDGEPAGAPSEITGLRINNDGNNVNLDRESRLLAENSIRFSVASSLAKQQMKMLKSAIQDGQGA